MSTPAPMPAGWYDDPFTDHLQRYWTGDSWTKETRPKAGALPPPPPTPEETSPANGAPVRDWLIPSILALIFCAWPLAIPAIVFSVRANASKKRGDMGNASQQAARARLFVILSVLLGIVVWVYLGFVIATTEVPTDQGTLTPFGA